MVMRWKHPFTSLICGPTGCGKTFFVKTFFRNLNGMCDTQIDRTIFCYSEWQTTYKEYGKETEFREELPQSSDYFTEPRPKLILDDLMISSSNKTTVNLFTRESHNKIVSVIFKSPNLFHHGHGQRDVSLNANYIVALKNPRGRAQFQHLARQICPEVPCFIQEAYHEATSQRHGYLLLDLKSSASVKKVVKRKPKCSVGGACKKP